MSRWTPTTWRRANRQATKESIQTKVKANLKTDSAELKAEEVTVYGRKEYHVIFHKKDATGAFTESLTRIFHNKDEANAMWVVLKQKHFNDNNAFGK